MSDEPPAPPGADDDGDVEAVCAALADADGRRVLAALEDPLTAKEVAQQCDLARTTTYRRLEELSGAGLVAERIEIREDGHHTTRYVRDASGVLVSIDGADAFDVEVLPDDDPGDGSETGSDADSVEERLAARWSRVREEL
jgi:DNA-binding transcriptional ArsR family regulator